MIKLRFMLAAALCGALPLPFGCGDDGGTGGGAGGDGPDNTGATCTQASECYPGIDQSTIDGEVQCLDRVRGGYCTHLCESDDQCCAVEGECVEGIREVCSPFESADDKMCFLSCEDEDLVAAPGQSGDVDEQEYCQRAAGRDFICRSSGGGGDNRKVCVPGDCGVGAACTETADCSGDLECTLGSVGGYCSRPGCTTNAGCPEGSLCVEHVDGEAYCFKSCAGNTDCTLCRAFDDVASCSSDVTFVEAGTEGTVCLP